MEQKFDAAPVCAIPDISAPSLAITYSPWQEWNCVYEAERALCRGTIFPCLDKPFLEGGCPNG